MKRETKDLLMILRYSIIMMRMKLLTNLKRVTIIVVLDLYEDFNYKLNFTLALIYDTIFEKVPQCKLDFPN